MVRWFLSRLSRVCSLAVALAVCAATFDARADDPLAWRDLPPVPDPVGFAGSFAGATGGALLVAGGANFPDRKPWEGGTKVWSDRILVPEDPGGPWKELAERLARPLGYGVSVETLDGLVLCGGSGAERPYLERG